jgi:hypothetical protein
MHSISPSFLEGSLLMLRVGWSPMMAGTWQLFSWEGGAVWSAARPARRNYLRRIAAKLLSALRALGGEQENNGANSRGYVSDYQSFDLRHRCGCFYF